MFAHLNTHVAYDSGAWSLWSMPVRPSPPLNLVNLPSIVVIDELSGLQCSCNTRTTSQCPITDCPGDKGPLGICLGPPFMHTGQA